MGASAAPPLSVEAYLAQDQAAEFKSEYHGGVLYPIIAASMEHGMIAVNVSRRLAEKLEDTPCRAVGDPVRVCVSPTRFVYPHLMVICGKPVMTGESSDTITNPKVIVEILSPSTEGYDYAGKLDSYRSLPSFEEYILIAQDRPRVHVF